MRRRCKIVATLGPSTDDTETLRQMIEMGLDVARLNFSHGSREEQEKRFHSLRQIAAESGRFVGVIGDLQGPKIRVRRFKKSSVTLERGDSFFLDSTLGDAAGSKKGVSVAYDKIHLDLSAGDILLLNDGQIKLEVTRVEGARIHTAILIGGVLSDHKGINREGGGLFADALTDIDKNGSRHLTV